jgi:hypothetical protein
MTDALVKRYNVPMLVISEDDEAIRIIETGWKDVYSVIREDAYQSQECGHKFMTGDEIEKKYNVNAKRLFLM